MIDPKFNDIPVEEDLLTEKEREAHARGDAHPRFEHQRHDRTRRKSFRGLTGRGYVWRAGGAGAGAGTTWLTPGADESAEPEIVPGARGTGTTALADAPDAETSTDRTSFDE